MKTKDVTVKDLEDLVSLIRKTWLGDSKCGTLQLDHVDGRAELRVQLLFPLSFRSRRFSTTP